MKSGERRQRLLVVGLNYAPEPIGIGPYTTGMCETLAEFGHEIEVVAGEAYYPQWRRYCDQRPAGETRIENGVSVKRCRHYIPAHPSGLRRMIHHLSFALSALLPAVRAGRRLRPDFVFVVAPSLLSVPVAWLAARFSRAKLWIHVQDFEVEAAFATGLLKSNGVLARLAHLAENRILALGDRVSTISPQMVARLLLKGIAQEKVCELRNWANGAFVPDSAEADRYRAEWDLGARKVALYSGNIANKQGIEIIVEAARLLRERDDIVFLICGEGPNRARLAELSADLRNVRLHDLQPAERMGGLLALASIHLLPQLAGAADLVLPSKLANMFISGRPVVATAAPGTGLHAEVDGCGIVTPPGDAAAFADAIAAVADDPERAAALGGSAARRAAERWHRLSIISQLEAKLLEVSGHSSAEPVRVPDWA
jgi:colanic acid biosynthesis glycosyl transferase WcaI